ncbi:MAG: class I SAM-dependent methyltransferase [Candidatus Heimdallarchaeota archaeon]|nr:class I SAM-dependent methyltransferase [Candidatus Heimdallarchaeota archaeon]
MNKQYWDEFYKNDHANDRSPFAIWVGRYLKKLDSKLKIVDVGCGNGRDTYFFNNRGIDACGIDQSFEDTIIEKSDFINSKVDLKIFDVVYSRFFIHALTIDEIESFIQWSVKSKYFVAEFRVDGDEPKIYKNHDRTLIDPQRIIMYLKQEGFTIEEYHVGRGMAKYKDEDPLVCRIIAKKK